MVMEIPSNHRRIHVRCMNGDCEALHCAKCKTLWHENLTCKEFEAKINNEHDEKNEAAFKNLMKQEKWKECPKCGIVIEKTEGCNHMTHFACPKSNNDEKRTDFCYCCKKLLVHKQDGSGWKYDVDGKLHFPNGIFNRCVHSSRWDASIAFL